MTAKPKKGKPFATEVDLCAAFLAGVDKESWTAYPETQGWDILLVRRADGFQIGVQAKLRLNTDVINQAIEDGSSYDVTRAGPDCRAVLVPGTTAGFAKICGFIGLTIIVVCGPTKYDKRVFQPSLPAKGEQMWGEYWYELAPAKRHALPEYVPDVAAGASAPLQLTDWKIQAIKIAVTLEKRGFVTRHDFKHHGIDHRRWVTMGWLEVKDGRFVAKSPPDFRAQHPTVYEQIKADSKKWLAPTEGRLI